MSSGSGMFGGKKSAGGSAKSGSKSDKDGEEKKSDGGGFGKFWQKFVLRKGPKEGSEKSLTSEQKNQLAAEVASGTLGLDSKATEQVAKALAAEMRRRHEERERRRVELMKSTAVQLPWGPKPPSPPALAPRRGPSAGASMYPIKMELKISPSEKSAKSGKAEPEAHTWDDSAWRPVSAVATGPTLEQQRKAWIEKSLKAAMGGTGKAAKAVVAQPSAAKASGGAEAAASLPEQGESTGSVSFGAQPAAIQMDEEAVKEIHAHTLGQMLQNIILEASHQQQQQQKKPKSAKEPPRAKKPEDMTAEELIALRKRDPTAWDRHTRQNTVISFGLTTPTEQDVEHGKKTKDKKKETRIHFEEEIEFAQAPVGRDFHFNEKLTRGTGVLKKK